VAAEVRSLAQRSATAAREIKSLIQDSVHKVETGTALVNRSGQTLGEIVTSVRRVTDIVGEIAAACQEQASGIEQVSKAIVQMDQVTQSNSSQTEEMSAAAEELAATAEQLQALVARFTLAQGAAQPQAYTAPVTPAPKPAARTPQALVNLARRVGPARQTVAPPAQPGRKPATALAMVESGFEEF
jgi:hypothetical protein